MSQASDNPVFCARRDDLGCTASRPGSKHDAIRAAAEGWFDSQKTGESFCPAHVPEWVAQWRARKQEKAGA